MTSIRRQFQDGILGEIHNEIPASYLEINKVI